MYDMTPIQWLKHTIFHPIEGFEDLRWKKQGSLKIAFSLVFLLFIAQIAAQTMKGFQFSDIWTKIFNIVPLLVQSVVYFATWVIGNWAICTLFDGEGNLKRVCIYSAYALTPYIVCSFISTFASNFLTYEESVWVTSISTFGLVWSFVLMLSAMKACHQYTISKTLISMVATVVTMVLMLFLLVLLLSLFQQVYVFFYTIYSEISYRLRT